MTIHAESFAELFEQSLLENEVAPGSIVTGTVLLIDNDWVTVHAGLKSEGVIPLEQFKNDRGEVEIVVGDEVEVAVEALEDGWGETRLSREKAKRAESWRALEKAHTNADIVIGIISGKVKGGFTVDLEGVRAFLPGSLVDIRPVRDTLHLEGKPLEFKVIKLDAKRNNVVVSRRAVLEAENSAEREAMLASLQEGAEVQGIVKNLTEYGAFVDLGGLDGLLHITDMAWKRIKHPSEIVSIGDEVKVRILKYDRERNRVSLGLKQLGSDPWEAITARYPEGSRVKACVTNLTDYGCFAELETGVEGLIHVSEMDWTNKNIHPSKVVGLGEELEVMVLDIDEERRRISLGLKQCKTNPWEDFAHSFTKNDRVSGKIKSITDFGIFIGLDGGIDGLIHLSDLSWDLPGEEAVHNYNKGDEIEAVILTVDSERERISLGVKQIQDDPFSSYVTINEKGSIVKGKVKEVEAKAATILLAEGVEAILKATEIMQDKVQDARTHLNVDDEVESRIINIDRKNRVINLSIKSKDSNEALPDDNFDSAEPAAAPKTIGDLIKAQLQDDNA